jgi:hypothetical protein
LQGEKARSTRSISPDEVLELFRAYYRLSSGLDPEVDIGADLNRDTTVSEWRATCDLVGTRRLPRFLNQWFGTELKPTEWRVVLEPEHLQTLGVLCDFISIHATLPDWRAISLGGEINAAAGAFFSLRGLLLSAGAPTDIRPSSSVADYAHKNVVPLGEAVAKLAPGLVPVPTLVWKRSQQWISALAVIGGLGGFAGALMRVGAIAWTGASLFLVMTAAMFLSGHRGIEKVEFGDYKTFRDLAEAIASYPRPMPNTR